MSNKSELVSGIFGFFGFFLSLDGATEVVGFISSILGLVVLVISILKMLLNGKLKPKSLLKWLFNSLKDGKITKEEVEELLEQEEKEKEEENVNRD